MVTSGRNLVLRPFVPENEYEYPKYEDIKYEYPTGSSVTVAIVVRASE